MSPAMPTVQHKTTASSSRHPQPTTTTTTQWSHQIPPPTTQRSHQIPPSTNPRSHLLNPTQPTPTPPPNPDLRPLFSRLSASLRHSFSQRRPWFEIVDRSTFQRPESISEATSRVRKNISYFRINYAAIIAVVAVLSLLSHPFSLFFLISLLAAWLYLYLYRPPDQPALLFDRTFSDREILGILIISTIMIVFLTGLGSLLISSIIVGLVITCVHGAFRVPREVFVDNQEPLHNEILSYIIGTAASAAVAAPPPAMRRV